MLARAFITTALATLALGACGGQAPGAEISGTVFLDANLNGVRDTCDPGLPKPVRLASTTQDGKSLEAHTDASGEFALSSVPPGDYVLQIPLPSEDHTWPMTIPALGQDNERALTLHGSERLSGLDFGLITAAGASPLREGRRSIYGVVFDDRNGNGRADGGECGLDDSTVAPVKQPAGLVLLGDEGRFELIDVPPLAVRLFAKPPDEEGTIWRQTYPASREGDCSPALTLDDPAGRGIALMSIGFQRAAGDGAVQGHVFSDAEGDGIRGPADNGIPWVPVSLSASKASCLIHGRLGTISRPGGDYAFQGLPAADWSVSAENPGPQGSTLFFSSTLRSQNAVLAPGATAEIDIGFHPVEGAYIHAKVIEDTNGNGAADPGEPGAAGVYVCYLEAGLHSGTCTASGDSGVADIGPLEPMSWRVGLSEASSRGGWASIDGSGDWQRFVLASGESASPTFLVRRLPQPREQ